jgi:anti-anti-sigma factor
LEEQRLQIDTATPGTLRVSGELDISTVEGFEAALRDAAGEGDLILDVGALDFMDSMGLAALVRVAMDLRLPARIVLRSPSESILRLLDMTGVAERVRTLVVEPAGDAG